MYHSCSWVFSQIINSMLRCLCCYTQFLIGECGCCEIGDIPVVLLELQSHSVILENSSLWHFKAEPHHVVAYCLWHNICSWPGKTFSLVYQTLLVRHDNQFLYSDLMVLKEQALCQQRVQGGICVYVSFLPHWTDATTWGRSLKEGINRLNEKENVVKKDLSFLTCSWLLVRCLWG